VDLRIVGVEATGAVGLTFLFPGCCCCCCYLRLRSLACLLAPVRVLYMHGRACEVHECGCGCCGCVLRNAIISHARHASLQICLPA